MNRIETGSARPRGLCRATLAAALAAAVVSGGVHAAGFQLIEHGAQGMGNAYAGGAANAEDLSVLWFNPAGATRFEGLQAQGAVHGVLTSFEFNGDFENGPVTAARSRDEDGGTLGIIPATYVNYQVSDRLWAGFALNAPFGLTTDYDDDWAGRYQALESEILSINAAPTLAFKVSDALSIGGGVDLMYFQARLTNAVDTVGAAVSAGSVPQLIPGTTIPSVSEQGRAILSANPALADSHSENEADGFGIGFNVGLLWTLVDDPDQEVRFGAHYRSPVNLDLDGEAEFDGPLTAVQLPGGLGPVLQDSDTSVDVKLPPKVSVSYYHRKNKVALMGDATWTGWSTLPELVIEFDDGGPPTSGGEAVERVEFKDSWRLSVGLAYYHDSRWTWRFGFAWDQSPARSAEFRTPRLPDNDRYWLAVGFGYKWNDQLNIDVGAAQLLVPDSRIDREGGGGDLDGDYSANGQLLSAQVRYKFK